MISSVLLSGCNEHGSICPPKKIYQTLLRTVDLHLFPLKSVGRDLCSLISSLSHCNWWVMIRTVYSPLPKSSKDELYFLTLPQLFDFYGSGSWQEKCKGTTTLPSAIQDAELSFDLGPCYERKRDVFSRLPQGDQQFPIKNLTEAMSRSEQE